MNSIPFTYLIGWSALNTYYYGVRYARGCSPSELWVSYFTSSKRVKAFRMANGEPDVVQVRRVFSEVEQARKCEHRVLRRMRVKTDDRFLNQTDNRSPPNTLGYKHRESSKALMSTRHSGENNAMFGKKHNEEVRAKMRSSKGKRSVGEAFGRYSKAKSGEAHPNYGKKQRAHVIEALRQASLGKPKSAEHRQKLGASKVGKKLFNNGVVARMFVEAPDSAWVRGQLSRL